VNNKSQEAWDAYKATLEKPEEMYVGWQNAEGTQFAMASAKSTAPPPSVKPMEAVWFFPATSWKEANRAWSIRNGWSKAGVEREFASPIGNWPRRAGVRVRDRTSPSGCPASGRFPSYRRSGRATHRPASAQILLFVINNGRGCKKGRAAWCPLAPWTTCRSR